MSHALRHARRFAVGVLLLQVAVPVCAQDVEQHEVKELTREDVGPYLPEHSPDLHKVEELIADGVNRFRKEQDLGPLEVNEQLTQTAQAFAQFMADKDMYGHYADRSPVERVQAGGYEFCFVTENIAYQFRTVGFKTSELTKLLLGGWKKSPPHRRNQLDPDVLETGVGLAQSKNTGIFYAVQLFGRPKSAAIHFAVVNRTSLLVEYKIGEQEFSLPGGSIRRHTACRAEAVQLTETDSEKQTPMVATDSLKPKDGDNFVVDLEGDRLIIKRDASALAE